jgi:hypothetical protein
MAPYKGKGIEVEIYTESLAGFFETALPALRGVSDSDLSAGYRAKLAP